MKKSKNANTGDIKDSKQDLAKMQSETIVIDMPEVKDIPGQENVTPPRLREMEDITVSSADEEGEGILDDLNKENDDVIAPDSGSNVSAAERKLLKKSAEHQPSPDTADFRKLALDDIDAEGSPLNEKGIGQDRTGEDLDVPGADLDDEDENIGAEDEENNIYSQRD